MSVRITVTNRARCQSENCWLLLHASGSLASLPGHMIPLHLNAAALLPMLLLFSSAFSQAEESQWTVDDLLQTERLTDLAVSPVDPSTVVWVQPSPDQEKNDNGWRRGSAGRWRARPDRPSHAERQRLDIENYRRNAPYYHADRIRTPLIIFHGDADSAVPVHHGWMQFREKLYDGEHGSENTLDHWAGYAPNQEDAKRLLESVEPLGPGLLLREVGSFAGAGDAELVFDLGGNVSEWILLRDQTGRLAGGSADQPKQPTSCEPKAGLNYTGLRVVRD